MFHRYTGLYSRFYPDVRDADGRSLMAIPGEEPRDFPEGPPDDGYWIPAEDIPAGPQVVAEAAEAEPAPVVAAPEPEPAPAVSEPSQPDPVPVAEPVPPAPESPAPYRFPGFVSPYVRA